MMTKITTAVALSWLPALLESSQGKASTVAQILAVGFVLLLQVDNARWVVLSRTFALGATMVLTVASGLHYAWMVSRRSIHSGAPPAPGAAGH